MYNTHSVRGVCYVQYTLCQKSVFHTISTVSEDCVPYSKDSVIKISALGGKRQCTLRTQAPVRSLCGPESLPQSRGSIPHEVQLHLHADVLSRLQVVEPFAAPPRSEQKLLLLYVMSRTWYVGIWVPAILTVQWYLTIL